MTNPSAASVEDRAERALERNTPLPPSSGGEGNVLQLILATGAFAVCFAIFGSVSAMMPFLRERLQLNPLQISIALAVPVLLGSLGRIPLGILADRYGGRVVFIGTLCASIVPAAPSHSTRTWCQA